MNTKQRNEKFRSEGLIKQFIESKTGQQLSNCKQENLALKALQGDFTKAELDLMEAAIQKPDEHFYIIKTEDLGEIGFAYAAMGKEYIIQSKEDVARQKASEACELKKELASKKWSEYISTEDYSMRTQLQGMEHKPRKQLELQAFLIGRAIRGESITDNNTKDYQEFLDKA